LIDLSLRRIVSHAIGAGVAGVEQLERWQALAENDDQPLYPLRLAAARARILGADSETVLAQC
jgi:hypothetical protein